MKKIITSLLLFSFFIYSQNIFSQSLISSTDTICIGGTVTFSITGSNDSCFNWTFGDGGTAGGSSKFATHTYNTSITGAVRCTLTAYQDAACTNPSGGNIFEKDIFILDTAVGTITPLPASVCRNTTVEFSPYDAIASSYRWNFGDGTFSTQKITTHKYTSIGTKNIKLILYKPCGSDTIFSSIIVNNSTYPFLQPGDASVSEYDTLICPGSKVHFNFSDGDYPDHTYLWYFDDGDSSAYRDPVHIYNTSTVFHPMFVITNNCGLKDTAITSSIHVSNTIGAPSILFSDFGLVNLDDTVACPGADIPFYLYNTETKYVNYKFYWNFGDGIIDSSNTNSPIHSYTANIYTPTLSAKNNCGDVSNFTIATIDVSGSFTGPMLQPTDYYFLNVIDSTCKNTPVQFIVQNYDTTRLSVLWFFGDGDSSFIATATHSYTVEGVYSPTLKTTNGCGYSQMYPLDPVHVAPSLHSQLSISTSPMDSVCYGDSLTFRYIWTNGSYPLTYNWEFGDGTSSSLSEPIHSYNSPAVYIVSLISWNGCGVSDTSTFNVNVSAYTKPTINFSSSNFTTCIGDTITFTPGHTGYSNYIWNFGDGFTSNSTIAKHAYNLPDDYDDKMYLKATNACGLSDSAFFDDVYDSRSNALLKIIDKLTVDAGADRSMVLGSSTILGGNPLFTGVIDNVHGFWSPLYGLDDSLIPHPIATPSVTTTYFLTVRNKNLCETIDSVTVHVQNTLAGMIYINNYIDTTKAGSVFLIKYDPTNSVAMPTVGTATINANGSYSFGYVDQGDYYLLADASTSLYPDAALTYYGDTIDWRAAHIYSHTADSNSLNICVREYVPPASGIGRIAGIVVEGQNYGKMMSAGQPVKGISVGLNKSPGGVVQMTTSDTTSGPNEGKFEFKNLGPGTYQLLANVTGVPLDLSFPTTTFTISATDSTYLNVGVYVDSNLISLTTNIYATVPSSGKEGQGISISKVYPNPASDHLDIEIDNYAQNTAKGDEISFHFFDIRGKKIKSLQPFELQKGHSVIRINSMSLMNGIYLFGIEQTNEDGKPFAKIVSKVVIVR